jgi:hypothetical protein
MTIINYPVLQYKSSLSAFLNYVREYNDDKPLREQLRPQHAKMYTRILTLLSRQLYENNKLFQETPDFRQLNDKEPVKLHTNRKALSWVENTIRISGNTAYRQVLRLMDAGVITAKINHGSQMNFELLINPEILLISDVINPVYKPCSKYLDGENKAGYDCLKTSFTPEYLISEKELFNNSNISVDKETRIPIRDNSVKEQERAQKKNILKEHREIAQNSEKNDKSPWEKPDELINEWNPSAEQAGKKEPKLMPACKVKLREYQKSAARWLFWYILNRLFEGRIFNPAHLENTLAYVEQHYFINCLSLKSIEHTRKIYKWRIDKAKRTIERHEINMQWIFPGYYLDLNRKGINPDTGKPYMSFINTASWPKKYEQFQKQKDRQKQKAIGLDLLNKQLRLFLNNPNLNQFKRCESYVRKNIPHLMEDFLNHFNTSKIQAHA